MSDSGIREFEGRIGKISRRHAKLERGYVTSINHDGLVIATPKRHRMRFPWRGLALTVMALFAFKAFTLVQVGPSTYDTRVEKLANGTVLEQAGAWVMQADPATYWLADRFRDLGL